jgi:hypothetical protein
VSADKRADALREVGGRLEDLANVLAGTESTRERELRVLGELTTIPRTKDCNSIVLQVNISAVGNPSYRGRNAFGNV